jgi:hypothetical protein
MDLYLSTAVSSLASRIPGLAARRTSDLTTLSRYFSDR